MGILTKDDIDLILDQSKQVEYGRLIVEFKYGECISVTHEGRVLTKKGKATLDKKKRNYR